MSAFHETDRIIVVGAGIAGLSATVALALDGWKVTVLERESELKEFGAGLQLGPNVSRLFDEWGMRPYLEPYVVAPKGVAIHDGTTGHLLNRIPFGRTIEKRHGAPYWVAHRGDLQRALLDRVADFENVDLKLGTEFSMYKRVDQYVCVIPTSGETLCCRALIGADGLWSKLRRQITGVNPDPEFSGRTAWRALIDAKDLPEGLWTHYTGLWLGPNAHLVHYPIHGANQLNIVALIDDDWQDEVWTAPGDPVEVRSHFTKWAAEPRRLLDIPRDWTKWPLFRQPRGAKWPSVAGPVALIGDAGHPIQPFIAQGAAMGIEDAASIAHHLRRSEGDISVAFRRFQTSREGRIRKVQKTSENMALIYHLTGPARLIRNEVIRRRNRGALLEGLDWLYGYQVKDEV